MEYLHSLINEVTQALTAKESEITKPGCTVIPYVMAKFKKLQIEGLSFINRASSDPSSDSTVILQYKNTAQELIIELNKIIV